MQKNFARQSGNILCLIIAGVACISLAWSQNPAPNSSLSPLTVTPEVCEKNDTITLTFTPATTQRKSRFDVVITDAYRGGQLAKVGREFRPAEAGALRLSLSFRADAGIYAVQVYDGKDPISEKATFIVPGVDRVERKEESRRRPRRDGKDVIVDEKDEGWWLVNGYPVSGLIWNGVPADHASLLRPTVKGGAGFNVVMVNGQWSMVNGSNFSEFARQGAFAFLSLESLIGVGFSGAGVTPMFNQRGEPQSAGCFNAPENRAQLTDWLKRLREGSAGSGSLPRAFLGFQLSQPRLPDTTMTCYCSYCAEEFRAFLKERYGDVTKFNARHKTDVRLFADVQPPRNPNAVPPSLWNDWQDFRFQIAPRFTAWLRDEVNKTFPERALAYFAGSTLSLSKGNIAPGANPTEGVDEVVWGRSKAVDVVGAVTSGEDTADRTDILVAAADPDMDGYPNKPVWVTYGDEGRGTRDAGRAVLTRMEAIAHGASGTFAMVPQPSTLNPQPSTLNHFLNQYANLFTGARVIGEVGMVVPHLTLKYAREAQAARNWEAVFAGISAALQRNHRTKRVMFPEHGIFPRQQPSALIVPLGEMVSSQFLKQLKDFVEEGGVIYLEGLPLRDETGTVGDSRLKDLMKELTGAEVEEVPLQSGEMTVDDVWVFGTANKMRLPVQVRGKITKLIQKPPPKRSRDGDGAKQKNPLPPETARVIATLPDGSPALIVNELGRERSLLKGLVIYTPNFIVRDAAFQFLERASRTHDPTTPLDQRYVDYYGAIADYLSPPLVRIKGEGVSDVRMGALLPNRNTLLIGFVNYGADKKSLELFVRTRVSDDERDFNEVNVYDLRAQKWLEPLPPKTAVVRLNYDLPARDWTFLAFTNHRRTGDFEKDLSEPRFKITVR